MSKQLPLEWHVALQTALEAITADGALSSTQHVENRYTKSGWTAVYVKVIRYDPDKLESDPQSGGLLAEL